MAVGRADRRWRGMTGSYTSANFSGFLSSSIRLRLRSFCRRLRVQFQRIGKPQRVR